MKRLFLTVVLAAAGWCAYAQNYMIVDSEKIFKSIDAYNTAIKDLDKMAEDYQKQVDDKFAEIESKAYLRYPARDHPFAVIVL